MLRMFLFLALIVGCQGYQYYQVLIPNGDNVPHPCKDNFTWRAVGHMDPVEGVDMNQFGIDFKSVRWSNGLCPMDSDGDGKTNGEELGDPDCVWSTGIPSRTSNISHPGICDPWGSEKCAKINSWVSCDSDIFKCNATSDPDVKNFTLRLPPTNVPAQKTSKYCMTVLLEKYLNTSQDYHLVASQPIINNSKVIHHIKLFGCLPTEKLTPTAEPCSNEHEFCEEMLAVWTLGLPGTCEYRDAGFLIGKNSFKKMVMQFDWANPELRKDYMDSSGLTLYYTSKLRHHNLGRLKFSQMNLDIPPGSKRSVESSCPAACTNRVIKDTIYLTSGMSHMNYLGYSMTVDQIREGTTILRLINDTNYSYDSPEVHAYTTHVEVRPGDELKTTCVYRSVSKNRTTTLVEQTCDSFFSYFPKENLRFPRICSKWKSVDLCNLIRLGEPLNGCSYLPYLNPSSDQLRPIIDEVLDSCNHQGQCRPECKSTVDRIKKNPCFQGDMAEYLFSLYKKIGHSRLTNFSQVFDSCVVFPSSSASLPVTSLFLMLLLLLLSL